MQLTILEAMVKGYYEYSFAVSVGEKFALKLTKLGHFQRELMPVLWSLTDKVEV